ncbi:MAG: CDP-alcohol phosphatidyltransferase family protein [Deltaproteobacteria bacterium]|nr:CDP-alcohol phosphatidyltransferase family protein [Deltaproteobacteria bacterium]
MIRIAEIRKKAQRKTSNLYDTFFTRPLSAYVTAIFLSLGVSANFVSVLNLANGVLACILIASGGRTGLFVGIGLIHLYAVLDSVDGELARFRETTSMVGRFLEDYSAYFMINGFNLAVSWFLFLDIHVVLPLYVAIGLASFGRNAMPCARRVILMSLHDSGTFGSARWPSVGKCVDKGVAPGMMKKLLRFSNNHLFYQTNMWVVLTSLMLIQALTNWSDGLMLYFGTLFYFSGWVLKELAVLVVVARESYFRKEVEQLSPEQRMSFAEGPLPK